MSVVVSVALRADRHRGLLELFAADRARRLWMVIRGALHLRPVDLAYRVTLQQRAVAASAGASVAPRADRHRGEWRTLPVVPRPDHHLDELDQIKMDWRWRFLMVLVVWMALAVSAGASVAPRADRHRGVFDRS